MFRLIFGDLELPGTMKFIKSEQVHMALPEPVSSEHVMRILSNKGIGSAGVTPIKINVFID